MGKGSSEIGGYSKMGGSSIFRLRKTKKPPSSIFETGRSKNPYPSSFKGPKDRRTPIFVFRHRKSQYLSTFILRTRKSKNLPSSFSERRSGRRSPSAPWWEGPTHLLSSASKNEKTQSAKSTPALKHHPTNTGQLSGLRKGGDRHRPLTRIPTRTTCRIQNPYMYHKRVGAGRRMGLRRRSGAGPGRTGRRRVGSPKKQPSPLPAKASRIPRTTVLNVSSEARTQEILCKPTGRIQNPDIPRAGRSREAHGRAARQGGTWQAGRDADGSVRTGDDRPSGHPGR